MRTLLVFAAVAALAAGPAPAKKPVGTHEQVRTIAVKGETKTNTLQTLALSADGHVLALVGSGRYGTPAKTAKDTSTEIQVFDADGKKVREWKVKFAAQAINGGPDGTVYVAGDGRLATFDKEGTPLSEIELPHVAKIMADQEKLKKRAEEQRKSEIESIEETIKESKKTVEEITKKDEKERTKEEKAELKQGEAMVKAYERMLETQKKRTVQSVIGDIVGRIKIVNAVAATEKDVFIACGESAGYGYSVWRMDRDLKNPKSIIGALGGCCGQMDIQASGDDIWVAENTKHAVGHYNRDGKRLGSFGKRGKDNEADCFGGCCNPMNVRVGANGNVYTAESEGFVRCFSPDGKALGLVGAAELKGGCKNVAVAVSKDGNTVFFCDQPGSRIIVLNKKTEAAAGGE